MNHLLKRKIRQRYDGNNVIVSLGMLRADAVVVARHSNRLGKRQKKS